MFLIYDDKGLEVHRISPGFFGFIVLVIMIFSIS